MSASPHWYEQADRLSDAIVAAINREREISPDPAGLLGGLMLAVLAFVNMAPLHARPAELHALQVIAATCLQYLTKERPT